MSVTAINGGINFIISILPVFPFMLIGRKLPVVVGIVHRKPIAIQDTAARLIAHSLEQTVFCVNLFWILSLERFYIGVPYVVEVLCHLFTDAGNLD